MNAHLLTPAMLCLTALFFGCSGSRQNSSTGAIDAEVENIRTALREGKLEEQKLDRMSGYGGAVTGYRDSTGLLRYVYSYYGGEDGGTEVEFFLRGEEPIFAVRRQYQYRADSAGEFHLENPYLLVEDTFRLNGEEVIDQKRSVKAGEEEDMYERADISSTIRGIISDLSEPES